MVRRWIFAAVLLAIGVASAAEPETLLPTDYAEARRSFTTLLRQCGPSPQKADALPAQLPKGVQEIVYKSGDLQLKGWLREQGDGQKHPAIVYCHGGFAF